MESITPELFAKVAELNISVFGLFLIILFIFSISAYVKIATVLSILRAGLGASSLPSFIVTGVVAVGLSFFVMYPALQQSISATAEALPQKSSFTDLERIKAIEAGANVWKDFAIKNTHPLEQEKFLKISLKQSSTQEVPESEITDLKNSWRVVAPAFIVSELKEAFATGLSLLLPLLIIDLLVAHVLAAMGLMNVNSHVVSFPFKILLFVMVDGWSLITNNLLGTY